MDSFFEQLHFPYERVRETQGMFIKRVYETLEHKGQILVSAPTGSGKTISALAPALHLAKKQKKTVICLTSRQTQANQIISTIKDLSLKAQEKINYVAFIGKRSMCVHAERDLYPASDFLDFCKKTREEGKCIYFKNAYNEEKAEEIKAVLTQSSQTFMSVEGFIDLSGSCRFCPYELAGMKAYNADIVVADYNYLFAPGMREVFLGKIGRELEDCIVVVDEAHNLPDRIRSSFSYTLTTDLIKTALKELKDFFKTKQYDKYVENLKDVLENLFFDRLSQGKDDYMITKADFMNAYLSSFEEKTKIEEIVDELRDAEALIKEEKIISQVGKIASFLERWETFDEESFLRVIEKEVKKDKTTLSLRIRCIDPGEFASEVLNECDSAILMSATLSPLGMYKDILGIPQAKELELGSPFKEDHQLTLVVDDVTTKYTARSPQMFKAISSYVEDILNSAHDKNAIVFFPSYALLDQVVNGIKLSTLDRKILKEQRAMTKEQKEKIVLEFKSNYGNACVLFAVTSGSFAEGLDLPEDALEMVLVVGLPLAVPDVFTQAVIRHFEKKFRKGELYGYVYPAMSKIIQAAGRCIRTESDRGVVVLLDNRFLWPKYALSFPQHWRMRSVNNVSEEIRSFFINQ